MLVAATAVIAALQRELLLEQKAVGLGRVWPLRESQLMVVIEQHKLTFPSMFTETSTSMLWVAQYVVGRGAHR